MARLNPWRIVATTRYPDNEGLGELVDARTRRLHFELTRPSSLSMTLDGTSPSFGWLVELTTDLLAYRVDEDGDPVLMFRGVVNQTEDELSETVDTVTLTATSYRGVLDRFQLRDPLTFGQVDQAGIFHDLVAAANAPRGTPFRLGLTSELVDPSGSSMPSTGILRDRTYSRGQVVGSALDDMATDISGYEWSVEPSDTLAGVARMWYPYRGRDEVSWVAHYGATVSRVMRTVSTSEFANYALAIGAEIPEEEGGGQYFAEAMTGAWFDPGGYPEGVWMATTSAPNVSVQSTLDDKAAGYVDLYGLVEPSYSLYLTPGRWAPSDAWLGDTVRLIVRRGRLDVDRTVRVMAVDITITEEGDEFVQLTVGRPARDLISLLRATDRRLDRLELR